MYYTANGRIYIHNGMVQVYFKIENKLNTSDWSKRFNLSMFFVFPISKNPID